MSELYDYSDFTSPLSALDQLGNAIRKALSSEEVKGPYYKARALTGYRQLTAEEVRYYGVGNTTNDGIYYGFNARMIDTMGYDALLDDVCDPAYAESPEYTNKQIAMHTMYIAADQELASQVTRGDIVLVRKEDLALKYGQFVSLYSIEAPGETQGEVCYALQNLNFAAGSKVGDKVLYNPDSPQAGHTGRDRYKMKCTHQSTGDLSKYFASIKPVEPGKQLGKFGKNNYRLDQPTLGNMKWFADKKVTKFYRLNNDGGAKAATCKKKDGTPYPCIKAGDLSHSYDPQTGLCIGSDLEGQFAKYLKPELIVIDASNTKAVEKYATTAASAGNTMIHCTHGADRTGFAVALALQKIGGKLPPKKGGSSSAGKADNNEDLYAYTVSFNSWDPGAAGTGGSICGSCKNMGFAVYLSHFYPIKDFCAVKGKKRMENCCACKRAASDYASNPKGKYASWGVTGTSTSTSTGTPTVEEKTEQQKCEEQGRVWYPNGWKYTDTTSCDPCEGPPGCYKS